MRLLSAEDLKPVLKERPKDCNKGDFGYIALVGGSLMYSGAITLAAMSNAAMRAGAGVATIAAPASICPLIIPKILESTIFPLSEDNGFIKFEKSEFDKLISRYRVIAFGMGVGNNDETRKALTCLLENYKGILIIDADGLNALSALGPEAARKSCAKLVLTPHVKEFSRLTGLSTTEIEGDRERVAKDAAKKYGAVILLKGSSTLVTDGSEGYIINRGCPGMATAGSGDVLSGICAAACSCCPEDLLLAAAAAAYINGLAGELAQDEHGAISMIASDTASCVGRAVKLITDTF